MSDNHLIPNSTQIPNVALDLLLPFLYEGEARVLLYIFRRTYGFNGKDHDQIALGQFTDGIRSESRQLDFGAGVSRQGAINALDVLKAIGVVEQLQGGQGRGNIPVYRLNLKCEMVQWLYLIAQESENAKELIVQRLDLLRQKGLRSLPYKRKPKTQADREEKVQPLDLSIKGTTDALEKVQPLDPQNQVLHKTKKDLSPTPLKKGKGRTNVDSSMWPSPEALAQLYNESTPDNHPKVKPEQLSPKRRTKALAILRDFPDRHWWAQAFSAVGYSAFLRGEKASVDHPNFVGDFDFFLNASQGIENCVKAYEGKYHDKPAIHKSGGFVE